MMMGGPPGSYPMNGMPPGMDMSMGMTNPIMLQEMMMNQMMLMQQMAGAIGMLNPTQVMNGGMPMQPVMGGDNGMFQPNMNGGGHHVEGRGRGRGRGVSNRGGRGRGGHIGGNGPPAAEEQSANHVTEVLSAPVVVAPTPTPATASPAPIAIAAAYAPLERPQSPTLCKFGLKCTNPVCRWSHPSPVATPESGVVLSNDPCESGKNCKNKDCIKAHVSPAVLNPSGEYPTSFSSVKYY